MGWINSLINLISNLLGFSSKVIDVTEEHRKDRMEVVEERAKKDSIDIAQRIEKDEILHEADVERVKFKAVKKKSKWAKKLNNLLKKKGEEKDND